MELKKTKSIPHKTFGCKAYAYIEKVKRSKFDEKVIKGIFLENSDRSKGYRVYTATIKSLYIES